MQSGSNGGLTYSRRTVENDEFHVLKVYPVQAVAYPYAQSRPDGRLCDLRGLVDAVGARLQETTY